jgi:hypothetical protein
MVSDVQRKDGIVTGDIAHLNISVDDADWY